MSLTVRQYKIIQNVLAKQLDSKVPYLGEAIEVRDIMDKLAPMIRRREHPQAIHLWSFVSGYGGPYWLDSFDVIYNAEDTFTFPAEWIQVSRCGFFGSISSTREFPASTWSPMVTNLDEVTCHRCLRYMGVDDKPREPKPIKDIDKSRRISLELE